MERRMGSKRELKMKNLKLKITSSPSFLIIHFEFIIREKL